MDTIRQTGAQVKVRLPADLKTWLQHQALDNRRTLNSEVVLRLEKSQSQQQAQGSAQ